MEAIEVCGTAVGPSSVPAIRQIYGICRINLLCVDRLTPIPPLTSAGSFGWVTRYCLASWFALCLGQ
jgi:hypothetical protein